ncbi:gas vesicle protein GvpM [Halopiger xanaduensis]|uniref:Gas vesicle protein GVPa n=1 Tax=Halopiger xanaduensis (strain DSM 18323 / JCM 14033 / SH-6) TaxID=797210 RepID=F8D734_HALXS|nr:gas vesicle protein [Halopiger xanaduensis]AEH35469.1 gas vesicle protein GVPa [Halopiger xanaduensis SH-6]
MRPRKDEETLVDVLDVLLRDGAILRADVIVSVADIPLVGIKLTAAIAGMRTMQEYGLFEEWDLEHRRTAITRRHRGKGRRKSKKPLETGTDEQVALERSESGSREETEERSGPD